MSITINGNKLDDFLDEALVRASGVPSSPYIIIQFVGQPEVEQKEELEEQGIGFLEPLGLHAYLCFYQATDLSVLHTKRYLRSVNVYRPVLKIQAPLQKLLPATTTVDAPAPVSSPAVKVPVSVTLHSNSAKSPADTITELVTSGVLIEDETTLQEGGFETSIFPSDLTKLAAYDSIRAIERVEEGELFLNLSTFGVGFPLDSYTTGIDSRLIPNGLTGEDEVINIVDGGFNTGNPNDIHPFFTTEQPGVSRCLELYALPAGAPATTGRMKDVTGHGTHVAGCALMNGTTSIAGRNTSTGEWVAGPLRGPAPGAKFTATSIFDAARKIMYRRSIDAMLGRPYTSQGCRISNHSYGSPVANPPQPAYDLQISKPIDDFIQSHDDLVVTFAAGNSGKKTNPSQQIGIEGACKNVITVGSTTSIRKVNPANGHWDATQDEEDRDMFQIAPSSSRGPTVEGRIKPDLCAPGDLILSACPAYIAEKDKYGVCPDKLCYFYRGTSMAAPQIAGYAAVLRQALRLGGVTQPTAALVKALCKSSSPRCKVRTNQAVINGAIPIDPGPPFAGGPIASGFGLANIQASLNMVSTQLGMKQPHSTTAGFYESVLPVTTTNPMASLKHGEVAQFSLNVPSPTTIGPEVPIRHTLKVTLTWMDVGGTGLGHQLGLFAATSGNESQRRHGNKGDTDMTAAPDDYDTINNVQQVRWINIPSGKVNIGVKCIGTFAPNDVVKYALAWTLEQ